MLGSLSFSVIFWRISGEWGTAFHAMRHLSTNRTNGMCTFRANKFCEAEIDRYEEEWWTNDKGENEIPRADTVASDRKPNQTATEE